MNIQTRLAMIASPLAQSGSNAEPFNLDSLSISEIETFTAWRIRALTGLDRNSLIDMNLPVETGTCLGTNPVILGLGPNEWLQLQLKDSEGTTEARTPPLDPGFYRWDQSDSLGILRVAGAAAPWLMRKNSGLDFSVNRQTPSHCAQCRFGKISVLVFYRLSADGADEFYLAADRSLTNYLWTLLISTAPHAVEMYREFGTD